MVYSFYFLIFVFKTVYATIPFCDNVSVNDPVKMCTTYRNYSKSTFPQPSPCFIETYVEIFDIKEVDENRQTIELVVRLQWLWNDTRLTFKFTDQNKPNGFPWFHVKDYSEVWVPRINFHAELYKKVRTALTEFKMVYPNVITLNEFYNIEIGCDMKFQNYPFDAHDCNITFNTIGVKTDFIEMNPISVRDYHVHDEKHEFNLTFVAMNPTKMCRWEDYCHSLGVIQMKLTRKSRKLYQLLGKYYIPTFIFSMLSLISYSISTEIVPGRMGLLVTLYLIDINTYISVDTPKGMGFSYVDIWMLGTQFPILIAILEYGTLLSIQKYGDGFIFGKRIRPNHIDNISFTISFVFLVVFNVIYWVMGIINPHH